MATENKKEHYCKPRDLYLKALMERAQIYQFTGHYDLSLEDWKTLRYATKEPRYRYEYYRGLSVLYERMGRFKSSATHLKKALLLCKRYPGLLNNAMIQCMQIRLMLEIGDYIGVIKLGLELLRRKEVKSLPENILCRLLTNIGNAYLSLGKYEEARHFFLRARSRHKRSNNLEGLSVTENNLTLVYWKKGDYHKALEYNRSALAIRNRIGHRYGASATLNNLGLINDEMGRYQEALSYYQKALDIFRELNDIYGMTIALSNIGSIYSEINGDVDKAVDYYKRSVELSRLTGDTYSVVVGLIELAEMYWYKKRYAIYEQLIKKAGRLIESIHSEEMKISYTLSLIKIYIIKRNCSKLPFMIKKLIKQISVSKNHLLRFETITSIINLLYEHQMSSFLPKIDCYVKEIEKGLNSVESPLKRAKILRGIVKYYLSIGNRHRANMHYRQWKTIVQKFKINAQKSEIDKIGTLFKILTD